MNDRQTFVDRMNERFSSITTGNGYQTNIGVKEKEWPKTPLDETEIDMVAIFDTIAIRRSDPNGENSSKHTWAMQVLVEAVIQESGDRPILGRKAISDINKAVGVDPTWGGLARRSEQVSEKLVFEKTGSRVSRVQVIFNVIASRKPWEA